MSQVNGKRIGLIIGHETDWPEAFMAAINERTDGITAELVKLGGTTMDGICPYDVIIDRMSHEIPYYRAYLQYAVLQGYYVINNPFTWSADNKFFGTVIINKLGLTSPRTIVLPNKHVAADVTPASFRNLEYPMDWHGIINYVGVPAIFKDIHSGGRRVVYRVHSVDELIQRYDESGTRTMILQELIESDTHIHCFVIGQEKVLALRYSLANGRYLPDIITEKNQNYQPIASDALRLTRAYGYDCNMVEFVIKDGKRYVINSTNPAPVMDRELMTEEQFTWCVDEMAALAVARVKRPPPQHAVFNLTI